MVKTIPYKYDFASFVECRAEACNAVKPAPVGSAALGAPPTTTAVTNTDKSKPRVRLPPLGGKLSAKLTDEGHSRSE